MERLTFPKFFSFYSPRPFTNYYHLSIMNGVNEMRKKSIFPQSPSSDWSNRNLAKMVIGPVSFEYEISREKMRLEIVYK